MVQKGIKPEKKNDIFTEYYNLGIKQDELKTTIWELCEDYVNKTYADFYLYDWVWMPIETDIVLLEIRKEERDVYERGDNIIYSRTIRVPICNIF